MITPLFPYLNICEGGHSFTSKKPASTCQALVRTTKEDFIANPKDCIFDKKKNIYLKRCDKKIDRVHTLPNKLEFNQVYSSQIFDGVMKGQDMRDFYYEVHKNIAHINLALDDIAKRLKMKLRNAGAKQRKI